MVITVVSKNRIQGSELDRLAALEKELEAELADFRDESIEPGWSPRMLNQGSQGALHAAVFVWNTHCPGIAVLWNALDF